jgi:hypothetical protein
MVNDETQLYNKAKSTSIFLRAYFYVRTYVFESEIICCY